MPNEPEQTPRDKKPPNIPSITAVHPTIAALEKADASQVLIKGFLGTSKDTVVRIYEALDTSEYVEIPREAIIHLEADENGEPGAVRAFVRASHEILSVRRSHIPAGNYQRVPPRELPPLRTCADFCELAFKPQVTTYNVMVSRSLREQNPQLAAQLWERAEAFKTQIKEALYACLTRCAQRTPGQFAFGIGGTYAAILARNHMDDPQ
jgi:hypothetical protein